MADAFPRHMFKCVICGETEVAQDQWSLKSGFTGKGRHIAPICRYCEESWGASSWSWTGDARRPHFKGGTYTDRRLAVQIQALTAALTAEANKKARPIHGIT